jgi:hypothetical protein
MPQQRFDPETHEPLCISCDQPRGDGDLYVEVREYDVMDEDARLFVHVRCLDKLNG